ncbi:hypothetical protein [Streptomyces sp. NPDC056821]|uniref:hypothetical protein n=1 Tax=unclassified Streptomyces TaxID=2593676 RepID=UPI0036A04A2E
MADSALWAAALTGGTAVPTSWVTNLGNVRAARTQAEASARAQHRDRVREARRAAYLERDRGGGPRGTAATECSRSMWHVSLGEAGARARFDPAREAYLGCLERFAEAARAAMETF